MATRAEHPASRLLPDAALTSLSIRSLEYRRLPPHERVLAERVRGEFNEMRGFSPTLEQAARLFNLEKDDCQRIFSELQREGFLIRCPDGRYRLA